MEFWFGFKRVGNFCPRKFSFGFLYQSRYYLSILFNVIADSIGFFILAHAEIKIFVHGAFHLAVVSRQSLGKYFISHGPDAIGIVDLD